jgi:uncharacterized protein
MNNKFTRSLHISKTEKESFFLWGPRKTGKTSLLKSLFPSAVNYDLLKTDVYAKLIRSPHLLREELLSISEPQLVILDEVQKVPSLLDEVHWLIENTEHRFALCGSSPRKLKRGHANLLGGRAFRYELQGLVWPEMIGEFDLIRLLNHGYLPQHYLSEKPKKFLRSYVGDYLKEEIAAEGLVRNLPAFSEFLEMASFSDTEMVSYTSIARDCGVSGNTIKEYFSILVDTMLGKWLPVYRKRPKRKISTSSKFYFSDVGVVSHLCKRGNIEYGSELMGKALENWVFHELDCHRMYSETYYDLSFWRLTSGIEVDFILGDMNVAIEVKSSSRVRSEHSKGLQQLKIDHPEVKRLILVCLTDKKRQLDSGVEIMPYSNFFDDLWAGKIMTPG